jgi:hypothetical protein
LTEHISAGESKGEKIMNAAMSLIAMVALLLALAAPAGTAKEPAVINSSGGTTVAPARIALNHNETLLRDTASMR